MPPEPFGLDKALRTDTSPLRPWEKYQVDACEWDEAISLQQAFREGTQAYHRSQKERQERDAEAKAREQALKKQVYG